MRVTRQLLRYPSISLEWWDHFVSGHRACCLLAAGVCERVKPPSKKIYCHLIVFRNHFIVSSQLSAEEICGCDNSGVVRVRRCCGFCPPEWRILKYGQIRLVGACFPKNSPQVHALIYLEVRTGLIKLRSRRLGSHSCIVVCGYSVPWSVLGIFRVHKPWISAMNYHSWMSTDHPMALRINPINQRVQLETGELT